LEIRSTGHNTIVVEWGQPESDGGSPLLGYNIAIRNIKKTMWMEVGRVAANMLKFNIRDLQEDHQYLIRIFARNEIGSSDPLESEEPYTVVACTGNYSFISEFPVLLILLPSPVWRLLNLDSSLSTIISRKNCLMHRLDWRHCRYEVRVVGKGSCG